MAAKKTAKPAPAAKKPVRPVPEPRAKARVLLGTPVKVISPTGVVCAAPECSHVTRRALMFRDGDAYYCRRSCIPTIPTASG